MAEVEVNGVFLFSKRLDSELIIKCLRILVNYFPKIAITSVVYDEINFGYRVYFSSPNDDLVLARKHFVVCGENIRIAPLRTILTIHGVRNEGGEQFEDKSFTFIEICNKLGDSLPVVPGLNLEDDITKKLRVCVDVPELEELDIFKGMFACINRDGRSYTVTFHCRRCESDDGHLQQNCPITPLPRGEITHIDIDSTPSHSAKVSPTSKRNSENKREAHQADVKKFQIKPMYLINNGTLSLGGNYLKSHIDDEKSRMDHRDVLKSSDCHRPSTSKSEKRDEEVNSKEVPSSAAQYFQDPSASSSNSAFGTASRSSSNLTTRTKPSKTVVTVNNLSPRLKECIRSACREYNIPNSKYVEAFLIHVKNRRDPFDFAKKYFKNPEKLKRVLERVENNLYTSSQPATKEEKRFLNWLTGLLGRF